MTAGRSTWSLSLLFAVCWIVRPLRLSSLTITLTDLKILRARRCAFGASWVDKPPNENDEALVSLRHLTILDVPDGWVSGMWSRYITCARLPALTSISIEHNNSSSMRRGSSDLWQQLALFPLTSITLSDPTYSQYLTAKPWWNTFTRLEHLTLDRAGELILGILARIPSPLRTITLLPWNHKIGTEYHCEWRESLAALKSALQKPLLSVSALEQVVIHLDGFVHASSPARIDGRSPSGLCKMCLLSVKEQDLAEPQAVMHERGVELIIIKGREGRRGGAMDEW